MAFLAIAYGKKPLLEALTSTCWNRFLDVDEPFQLFYNSPFRLRCESPASTACNAPPGDLCLKALQALLSVTSRNNPQEEPLAEAIVIFAIEPLFLVCLPITHIESV